MTAAPGGDAPGRHAAVLAERRAALTEDHRRILATLAELRQARAGQPDDDEHDPEGPTTSAQWSHAMAIKADVEARLAEVDRAVARVRDGTYGVCLRCGAAIAGARLDARPTAELCMDCARRADAAAR